MLKFYPKFLASHTDLPGQHALILHTISGGCNLHCYHCHNYQELIVTKHDNYYTTDIIMQYLGLNEYLFDAIILSGGEFLNNSLPDIEEFLLMLKTFHKKIIINTNGILYDKIQYCMQRNLVDG